MSNDCNNRKQIQIKCWGRLNWRISKNRTCYLIKIQATLIMHKIAYRSSGWIISNYYIL